MSNVCNVYDGDLPASGYTIDRMLLEPVAGKAETLATAHWIPGLTGNLLDLKSSRPLCRQMAGTVTAGGSGYTTAPTVTASDDSLWTATVSAGAVTSLRCTRHSSGSAVPTLTFGGPGTGATATVARQPAPTIGANSLTVAAATGAGKGLIAQGITDSATQTLVAVYKKPIDVGGGVVVFGTANANTPSTGSMLWHSNTTADQFARSAGMDAGGAVNVGSPGSPGDWLWAGVSYKPSTGRATRLSGGTTTSTAGTKTPGIVEIALANAWNTGFSNAVNLEVAEFIVFPTALTAAEMEAVYLRSKARLAALTSPVAVL